MKSNRSRLDNAYLFWPVILTGLWLFFPGGMKGVSAAAMNADEFLDYTLKNLQQRIVELNQENQKLNERNDSMRSRIQALKGEYQSLAGQKTALSESRDDLQDDAIFGSSDYSLRHQKLDNASRSLKMLEGQKQDYQALIRKQNMRQETLRQEIASLAQRIQQFQGQAEDNSRSDPRPEYRKKISQVTSEISLARARVSKIEAETDSLRKQVDAAGAKAQDSAIEKRNLEDQISRIQDDLQKMLAEKQRLQETASRLEERENVRNAEAGKEIGEWRQYRDQLKEAINKVDQSRNMILSDSRRQEQRMAEWAELLKKENGLLLEREKQLVQAYQVIAQTGQQASQGSLDEVNAKISELTGIKEEIQAKINAGKNQAQLLLEEQKKLFEDIANTRERLQSVRGQTRHIQKSQAGSKRKELLEMIREKKNGLQEIHQQIGILTDKVKQLNDSLGPLQVRRQNSQAELTAIQDEQQAMQRMLEQAQAQKQAASQRPKPAGNLAQEIDDLKLRHDILSSSLAAVQSRFDAQNPAAEEFKQEEAELNEYLRILEAENKGLQEKILTLMSGYDRLEDQIRPAP